jgi:hypothetical protein
MGCKLCNNPQNIMLRCLYRWNSVILIRPVPHTKKSWFLISARIRKWPLHRKHSLKKQLKCFQSMNFMGWMELMNNNTIALYLHQHRGRPSFSSNVVVFYYNIS